MVPTRETLNFIMVWTLFDESGNLKNREFYAGLMKNFMDELVMYANKLKQARK